MRDKADAVDALMAELSKLSGLLSSYLADGLGGGVDLSGGGGHMPCAEQHIGDHLSKLRSHAVERLGELTQFVVTVQIEFGAEIPFSHGVGEC